MRFLITLFCLVLFLLGFGFFYSPEFILRINTLLKRLFLDNSKLLANRKKFGLVCIGLACLIFYFGVYSKRVETSTPELNARNKVYRAWYHYYHRDYAAAEKLCNEALKIDPENTTAIKQLCLIHFIKADYKQAKKYCDILLAKEPGNQRIKKIYEIITRKSGQVKK